MADTLTADTLRADLGAEAILDTMGGVLARWTMGGEAVSAVLPAWREALGEEQGEAELRLLALSGQFLELVVAAAPQGGQGGALRVLPDVPRLALPTIPDALRPLTRRVLQQLSNEEGRGEVLHFLAGRGWTIHPADWMPSAEESCAPDIYAQWRDWVQGAASGETKSGRVTDELTAETWDLFYSSERNAAFRALRRHDPDSARALLEAKLASADAKVRLRLVEALSDRLSEADVPFLETLAANDRAPKVKAQAALFLARLGRTSASEDITELAEFFEVRTMGLLGRTRGVRPQPLKTNAQKTRRASLLAEADFSAFAKALELTPLELIEAWKWGNEPSLDLALSEMAERSAPDDLVMTLADQIVGHPIPILKLALRLPAEQRTELAMRMVQGGDTLFNALKMGGPSCRIDNTILRPAGAKLLAVLQAAKQAEAKGEKPPQEHAVSSQELHALGLIASRTGAEQALEELTKAGLLHIGPGQLDMIRLNAALEDRGVKG